MEPITLKVPFEMRRRGQQVRLVITGRHSAETEPVSSLTRAVALAREWADRIAAGEVSELNQLATEYRIERSYAQKVFRCVAPAPQHVEAILSGKHDAGLTFVAATAKFPSSGKPKPFKSTLIAAGLSDPRPRVQSRSWALAAQTRAYRRSMAA